MTTAKSATIVENTPTGADSAATTIDSHVPAGEGVDRVGAIENRGIDFIPESERRSRPRDLFWVLFGAQWCYAVFILGGALITLGLSWWSALSATLVGSTVGSAILCGMSFYGPRTGTTATLSSSAVFGIRGRYVGSLVSQVIDLAFNILSLWGGGLALVYASHRLLHTPTGNAALAVAMLLVAVGVVVLGVLGHATVIASLKLIGPLNFLAMVVLVALKAGDFRTHPHGVPYALGGFGKTWLLGVTIAAVNPISYGACCADYSRYMPSKSRLRALAWYTFVGACLGNVGAYLAGAFVTLTFASATTAFTAGMIQGSPIVYLLPLLLIGTIGNVGNVGLSVYNSSLDLQAILWRLRRIQVAVLMSALTVALAYLFTVVVGAQNTINGLITIILVLITPWIVINLIGFAEHRGRFDAFALHAYGDPSGPYWYRGGVNIRAVTAWLAGVCLGLMFTHSSLISGPLDSLANGVDLSFTSAGIVGGAVYLALTATKLTPATRTAARTSPVRRSA
jgi:purine-cytosine permease-like protein